MKKFFKIAFAIGSSILVLLTSLISPMFAKGQWQAEFVSLASVDRDYPLYAFSSDDRSQPYVIWNDPLSYIGYFKIGNEVLFCLEPDVWFESTISYTRQAYNEEVDAVLSQNLLGLGYSPAQITQLARISSVGYGFQGDFSDAMASATQIKLWEVKHPGQISQYSSDIAEKLALINERLQVFEKNVSFHQETLHFPGYGEENALVLEDTNQVFRHYFPLNALNQVQIEPSGNTLKVWIEKGAPKAGELMFQALYEDGQATNTKKCYYDNYNQTIGQFGKVNTPKMQINYTLDLNPLVEEVKTSAQKEGKLDVVLRLKKSDVETGKPISNVEFALYKDDEWIHSAKTDKNGEIHFNHIETNPFVSNEHSASYVTNFDRFDEESQNQFLAQGYFGKKEEAYASAQQQAEQEVSLAVNEFEMANHMYKAVETQSGKGYYLDPEKGVSLMEKEGSGQVEFEVVNQAIKGEIEIMKVGERLVGHEIDEENQSTTFRYEEMGLAGVEFSILAQEAILDPSDDSILFEKGALVDQIVTDEEGKAKSGPLPLGSYTVQETKGAEGFVLDETNYEVELKAESSEVQLVVQNQTIRNERMKASIEINKLDSKTKLPLEKAVFALMNIEEIKYIDGEGNEQTIPADTVLETKESDEKGQILFESDLPYGKYEVKEIEAAPGYICSGISQVIEQADWKEALNRFVLHFENDFHPIYLQIHKVDQYKNPIVNQAFAFGLYQDGDWMETKAGDLETGLVEWVFDQAGVYEIKEEQAPDGYVLSDEIVQIEIGEDGTLWINGELQEEKDVHSFPFVNERLLVVQPQVPTGVQTGVFGLGAMFAVSGLAVWFFKKRS